MEEFDALKKLVADTEEDVAKVDAGNKAAGSRVRKAMMEIKKSAQAIREKVLAIREPAAPTAPPAPPAPQQ